MYRFRPKWKQRKQRKLRTFKLSLSLSPLLGFWRMKGGSIDRWTGILKVPQNPNNSGPFFKVAASLLLSPSSTTLAVPSANAIFFKGDRVAGTGNQLIERLSESKNVAEILVSKLGATVNAWVVEASTFSGPFAVYREFVPSVNARGEPERYDPDGFPASSAVVDILLKSVDQVKNSVLSNQTDSDTSQTTPPMTAVFGFSKGGTVVNQIVSELAHLNTINILKEDSQNIYETIEGICPASIDSFLHSINKVHYVDAGLNCHGAYLTDHAVINNVGRHLMINNSSLHFLLHGTPRQWCDRNRPWIPSEKDKLVQLLQDASHKYEGRLQVLERLYFADKQPTLQMHFEIIQTMDVC